MELIAEIGASMVTCFNWKLWVQTKLAALSIFVNNLPREKKNKLH
jgi:hypothetical protein